MTLDEAIEFLELGAESWNEARFKRISKWLNELKRLRKEVKKLRESDRHCKLVHGTFFDELAKQGVLA